MSQSITKRIASLFFLFLEQLTISRMLLLWAFFTTIFSNSIFTHGTFQPTLVPLVVSTKPVVFTIIIILGLVHIAIFNKGIIYADKNILLICLYFFSSALSLILNHFSVNNFNPIMSYVSMFCNALIAIIFVQVFSFKDIVRIGRVFLVFALINASVYFLQLIFDPLSNHTNAGFFGDPNLLARFLDISLVFLLLRYFYKSKRKLFSIELLLSLAILICVTLLLSRSGYIFTFLTLSTLIFWVGNRRIKKTFFIVGPIILILFAFMYTKRVQKDHMTVANYSDLGRISVMKAGINMIKHSPVFGVGYGLSGKLFTVYQEKSFPGLVDTIHNAYICVFAEQGLFGISIYLMLNFGLLFSLFRKIRFENDPQKKRIYLYCFYSLSIYLLYVMMFPLPDYEGVYWIIVAMCIIALKPEGYPKVSAEFNRFTAIN
jgi:O-antigen ligase